MARLMPRGRQHIGRQGGFTYFGVIISVALIGMTLALVGTVARTESRREREAQLLWVGGQYRAALTQFSQQNGGQLPQALHELVLDEHAEVPRHFLRKLYPDPMTGAVDWPLLTLPGGGIYGVASSSTLSPLKLKGFKSADRAFEDATCYKAWQFVVVSRRLALPITTSGAC